MKQTVSGQNTEVAVVGAGVVGLSCALWLQIKGFKVTLIDPKLPGSVTSYGNACTIADYGCIPVNSPVLFKSLPSLLLREDTPLSINLKYTAMNLPWCLRFLSHCRSGKVAHTRNQLAKFLAKTYDGLNPLLDCAKAQSLLQQNGCLHLFKTEQEHATAREANDFRKSMGLSFREVSGEEIKELEPSLTTPFARGILFEYSSQVSDPQILSDTYLDCFKANKGLHIRAKVESLKPSPQGVELQLSSGAQLNTNKVVIAAGAFSKSVKGAGVEQLPLDTERGYHVQYNALPSTLNRPISWNAKGFYLVPMKQGLRVVGTVEIAGNNPKINPRRIDYLVNNGRKMLDLPEKPDQQWLGFRPTMPDSLPVIGESPQNSDIVYAFGHHHLGLTLAGITGKVVSELIAKEPLSHNIDAFSAARF